MADFDAVKKTVNRLVRRRIVKHSGDIRKRIELLKTCSCVFLGPPGTGKTTVAKLFGQNIADLEYTESKHATIKPPADFFGC